MSSHNQSEREEPCGESTFIWRDGTVLRELSSGLLVERPSIPPLPESED